jgi:hypothetical protein
MNKDNNIHQVRTSEGVPKETRDLISEYSLDNYVDLLEQLIIRCG